MIKRVKQSKFLSVVVFLCVFIIVAYISLNVDFAWKPRRVEFHNFPKNYVYRKKNVTVERKVPGLKLTGLPKPFVNQSQSYLETESNFFKFLEQKQVICDDDVRHGNQHDGGWNVCMSPPFTLKKPCLVYSFGIGDDWRFEDDVHDRYGCKVLAFDPSIHMSEHNRTEKIWFKPVGLGGRNRISKENWRLKTLQQHLKDEGHLKTTIDYLKFDIEYMEWNVLTNILKDKSLMRVKQLGFEIHLRYPEQHNPKELMISKSEFIKKYQILKLLEKRNFKKFNYRLNPFCMYKSKMTSTSHSFCYELHFLNFRFVEKKHLNPLPHNSDF